MLFRIGKHSNSLWPYIKNIPQAYKFLVKIKRSSITLLYCDHFFGIRENKSTRKLMNFLI